MKIMGPLHCFYLIIVMLSVDINVAQDSQGQCSVAKRYRVRDELQRSTKSRNFLVSAVSEGAEIEPKCFCISVTFCRNRCFCKILSFCRNTTIFLQKAFSQDVSAEINLSAEIYHFLQKPSLSAEINLFLQKVSSFCQLRLSAETFCFLYPLFRFRPTPFRLISTFSRSPYKHQAS